MALRRGFSIEPGEIACAAPEKVWNKGQKRDLALIMSEVPASVAGMFTTNQVCAVPVKVCVERVKKGIAQAIVVNSGNANACTGKQGLKYGDQNDINRREGNLRKGRACCLNRRSGTAARVLPEDSRQTRSGWFDRTHWCHIHCCSTHLLGRHVADSAHDDTWLGAAGYQCAGSKFGTLQRLSQLSQAEVQNFQPAILGDK